MDYGIDYSFILIVSLFSVGLLVGLVDSVGGGGGLITYPVFVFVGLPPAVAIGTDQIQSMCGLVSSVGYFSRKRLLKIERAIPIVIVGLIFGFMGARTAVTTSSTYLHIITTLILFIASGYIIFSPKLTDDRRSPVITRLSFVLFVVPFLTFYDGFFGAASTLIMILCLTYFLGYNATKSMAYARLINISSNTSAAIYFIAVRQLDWIVGLSLAMGSILGSFLGSFFVFHYGAKLMRPSLVVVAVASVALQVHNVLRFFLGH